MNDQQSQGKPQVKCEREGCHNPAKVELRQLLSSKNEHFCGEHADNLRQSGVKIVSWMPIG